jgi:hypothetical protein
MSRRLESTQKPTFNLHLTVIESQPAMTSTRSSVKAGR